jgi:hypothetical protein
MGHGVDSMRMDMKAVPTESILSHSFFIRDRVNGRLDHEHRPDDGFDDHGLLIWNQGAVG